MIVADLLNKIDRLIEDKVIELDTEVVIANYTEPVEEIRELYVREVISPDGVKKRIEIDTVVVEPTEPGNTVSEVLDYLQTHKLDPAKTFLVDQNGNELFLSLLYKVEKEDKRNLLYLNRKLRDD